MESVLNLRYIYSLKNHPTQFEPWSGVIDRIVVCMCSCVYYQIAGMDIKALPGYAKRPQRRHLPRREYHITIQH